MYLLDNLSNEDKSLVQEAEVAIKAYLDAELK